MTLRLFFGAVSLSFLIFACSVQAPTESTGAGDDGQTSESDIARGALCRPCARSEQCGASSACAQYAGSDYCARACESASSCGRGEACAELTTLEGQKVKGCVSASGACGSPSSCGKCQSGRCDLITGMCESAVAADLTGPAPRPSLSAPRGVVGAAGGTVTRMYFAVIGDTRPAMLVNTSGCWDVP